MTTLKPLIAVLGLLTLAACEKPVHPDAMMSDGDAMMSEGEAMMSDGDTMMSDGDTMSGG